MRSGIPIGAAKSVTMRMMPKPIKTNPIIAARTRPVSFIRKLNRAQTMTKGKNRIEVFLR